MEIVLNITKMKIRTLLKIIKWYFKMIKNHTNIIMQQKHFVVINQIQIFIIFIKKLQWIKNNQLIEGQCTNQNNINSNHIITEINNLQNININYDNLINRKDINYGLTINQNTKSDIYDIVNKTEYSTYEIGISSI